MRLLRVLSIIDRYPDRVIGSCSILMIALIVVAFAVESWVPIYISSAPFAVMALALTESREREIDPRSRTTRLIDRFTKGGSEDAQVYRESLDTCRGFHTPLAGWLP